MARLEHKDLLADLKSDSHYHRNLQLLLGNLLATTVVKTLRIEKMKRFPKNGLLSD